MIVELGNEVWRGASAPTPFWRRTIEVFSEMIGRSWSEREGVASRRALFAQRTGYQLRTGKASEWLVSKKTEKIERVRGRRSAQGGWWILSVEGRRMW
jgi:hypothetical protein